MCHLATRPGSFRETPLLLDFSSFFERYRSIYNAEKKEKTINLFNWPKNQCDDKIYFVRTLLGLLGVIKLPCRIQYPSMRTWSWFLDFGMHSFRIILVYRLPRMASVIIFSTIRYDLWSSCVRKLSEKASYRDLKVLPQGFDAEIRNARHSVLRL